jgi:membrane-bound metal-dependent hydrolase YbcI (DUF457 family)
MDPLTHVVVGRAVIAALPGERRLCRGAGAAAVLGALAPDVDVAVAFAGWDRYLRVHEIGTHSIAGGTIAACAAAAVVHLWGQTRDRPGTDRGPTQMRLVAAALAGAMSHLALDVISGARIRLGWPVVDLKISLPLVAMADPWIIGICVLGLLARWPAGLTMRTAARAVLGVAFGFLCLKGTLLGYALSVARLEPVRPRAIEARWGALSDWYVFDRTADALRRWTITSRGAPAVLSLTHRLQPESALVRASRSLETVGNFLAVHEFGFADERPGPEGRTLVLWSDVRYCNADLTCGLWFGGAFGADGRAITQLVTVGDWTQKRPAPP